MGRCTALLAWVMIGASGPSHAEPKAVPRTTAAPLPDRPLSTAARDAVDAWQARAAPCERMLAAIPSSANTAQGLRQRALADQCFRLADRSALVALGEADRNDATTHIWRRIAEVDAANTAYLRSVLSADGWFKIARDGQQVTDDAWLIVQHSPDQAFQRDIVRRMAPLAAAGEVSGRLYAMLYDRTEMFVGRPQYYGSQYRCEKGRWVPFRLRDPAGVEARRKALGMTPMAVNAARINAGGGC